MSLVLSPQLNIFLQKTDLCVLGIQVIIHNVINNLSLLSNRWDGMGTTTIASLLKTFHTKCAHPKHRIVMSEKEVFFRHWELIFFPNLLFPNLLFPNLLFIISPRVGSLEIYILK